MPALPRRTVLQGVGGALAGALAWPLPLSAQDRAPPHPLVPPVPRRAPEPGPPDATAMIQARLDQAAAAGGGTVTLEPGTYSIGPLRVGSRTTLMLRGVDLQFRGLGRSYAITLLGRLASAGLALRRDARPGDIELHVAGTGGLKPGDFVVVWDRRLVVAKPYAQGRNAELQRVADVRGETVVLAAPLIGGYAMAEGAEAVAAAPCEQAGVIGGTVRIAQGERKGGGIALDLTSGCVIEGTTVVAPCDRPGLSVLRSRDFTLARNIVRDGQLVERGGHGYGWSVDEWSHHGTVTGNFSENLRENVVGNRARFVSVTSNIVRGCIYNGINTHGRSAEGIVISGNVITGTRLGAALAVGYTYQDSTDADVTLANNILRDNLRGAIQVAGAPGRRNRGVIVTGNLIDGFGSGAPASAGIFVYEAEQVRLADNLIRGRLAGVTQRGIHVVRSERVSASGNNIEAIRGIGIDVQESRGVTVTGSDITGTDGAAVRTAASADVALTANSSHGARLMLAPETVSARNDWDGEGRR